MTVSLSHITLDAAIAAQPEREQKLLAACATCVDEGFWLVHIPANNQIIGTIDRADT